MTIYRHAGRRRIQQKHNLILPVFFVAAAAVLLLQYGWMRNNRLRFLRPSGVEIITCPFCNGSGFVRDPDDQTRWIPCPVCFGVGLRPVRHFDDYDILCPACGGMGRIYDPAARSAHVCRRCHGRGLIRRPGSPPLVVRSTARKPKR